MGRSVASRMRGDPPPLLSSGGATSAGLAPRLGSPAQDKQGRTGEGPAEATKGTRAPLLGRKAEGTL